MRYETCKPVLEYFWNRAIFRNFAERHGAPHIHISQSVPYFGTSRYQKISRRKKKKKKIQLSYHQKSFECRIFCIKQNRTRERWSRWMFLSWIDPSFEIIAVISSRGDFREKKMKEQISRTRQPHTPLLAAVIFLELRMYRIKGSSLENVYSRWRASARDLYRNIFRLACSCVSSILFRYKICWGLRPGRFSDTSWHIRILRLSRAANVKGTHASLPPPFNFSPLIKLCAG